MHTITHFHFATPAALFIAAALLAPAAAGASTITRAPNGAVVLTAAPSEVNRVVLGSPLNDEPGWVAIDDRAGVTTTAEGCETGSEDIVDCRVDAGLRLDLGDGADSLSVSFGYPSTAPLAVDGGTGDDTLAGGAEADTLDGGPGNDSVDGGAGPDTVLGGDGDDILGGDRHEDPAADRIDGGAGLDTLKDAYSSRYADTQPDVAITLAGGDDDGRPGEGDDVRGVELVVITQGGSLTGTDASEDLEAFQTVRPVRIAGGGGADVVKSGGGDDAVDGGAGDDDIDAGYGNDHVVGGPGRDVIHGDLAGGDCGPLWCTLPYGNDTVDARDGEADSVDCGPGQDTVSADAVDIVAPDCETVDRPDAVTPAGQTPTAASCRVPRVLRLTVHKAKARLRAAGCRVSVTGHGRSVRRQSIRAGRTVPARTVVRLTRGR